ncbi:MAG: flagellar basal-body MS-ring/collar protein FliF [Myxococcota bacterium]
MADRFQDLLKQFSALSPVRQVTLVATTLGSLAFFFWIATGARSSEFRTLYRGLEDAEAAQVVEALTAERIEHRLAEGGTAIEVPVNRVHEARMRVASRGLPSGNTPGFEIFDKGSFGVTDFVQKVNYHRALQGELARTIEQVEGVEKARVQLALPERKALLRKDERKATASVVLRLRGGYDLEPPQIRGIVHLVASSVEGLDPAQVTLVDNRGRLLAPQSEMDPSAGGAPTMLRAARSLERELEDQVESILERTVGLGRVVAKVNARVDWTQTETTEEIFDPNSQIERSTQRESESSSDSTTEGGVVGIVANSPEAQPGSASTGTDSSSTRTSETINYELSKTVSHHVLPTGKIERLSVAVLIDGKPVASTGAATPETPGAGGEVAPTAFMPWSAEEIAEFEQLAKRAVGFSAERGDEISVINAPFQALDAEFEAPSPLTPDVVAILIKVLEGLVLVVALFLFSRLFVRPLADAVGGNESAALKDLRKEVMTKIATVQLELAGGVVPPDFALDGELPEGVSGEAGGGTGAGTAGGSGRERKVASGRGGGDLEIPGLMDPNGSIPLPAQVDRLAQLRPEDSVRTIRGWMSSGS